MSDTVSACALIVLIVMSGVGSAAPTGTGDVDRAKRRAEPASVVVVAWAQHHEGVGRIRHDDAGMSGVSVSSILALMGAAVISRRRFGLRLRGTPEDTSYPPYRMHLASGHEGQRGK